MSVYKIPKPGKIRNRGPSMACHAMQEEKEDVSISSPE
jgi:hypothetical protein